MTAKDSRLYQRYCPTWRRILSGLMLLAVFPGLTSMDLWAWEALQKSVVKQEDGKAAYKRLRETAPQHLRGNLLPRLRRLALKVQSSEEAVRENRAAGVGFHELRGLPCGEFAKIVLSRGGGFHELHRGAANCGVRENRAQPGRRFSRTGRGRSLCLGWGASVDLAVASS